MIRITQPLPEQVFSAYLAYAKQSDEPVYVDEVLINDDGQAFIPVYEKDEGSTLAGIKATTLFLNKGNIRDIQQRIQEDAEKVLAYWQSVAEALPSEEGLSSEEGIPADELEDFDEDEGLPLEEVEGEAYV